MITKDRYTSCRYTLVITDRKKIRRRKKKDRAPEEKMIAFATGDPGMDVDAYAKRRGIKTPLPAGPEHPDQDVHPEPGGAAPGVHPRHGAVRLPGVRLYMLAWTNSRTVPSEQVMVPYAMVGALPDVHLRGPSEPWPPDPDWPFPGHRIDTPGPRPRPHAGPISSVSESTRVGNRYCNCTKTLKFEVAIRGSESTRVGNRYCNGGMSYMPGE